MGARLRDSLPSILVGPVRVNNGTWVASELGPLIPQQRTCSDYCGMSVWCQYRKPSANHCPRLDLLRVPAIRRTTLKRE
jgi:hypothetical protein